MCISNCWTLQSDTDPDSAKPTLTFCDGVKIMEATNL